MRSKPLRLLVASVSSALALAACSDDESPRQGGEGLECYPNGTCNEGLACVDGTCRVEGGDTTDDTADDADGSGSDTGSGDTAEDTTDTGAGDTGDDAVGDTDPADTTDDTDPADTSDDTGAGDTDPADTTDTGAVDTSPDTDTGFGDDTAEDTGGSTDTSGPVECVEGPAPVPDGATALAGGETCDTATAITAAGRYGGDTCSAANDYPDYAGACGPFVTGSGTEVVYALTIPANTSATISLDDALTFNGARLLLTDDCGAIRTDCDAYSGVRVTSINATGAPTTVWVVVEGFIGADGGSYVFDVAFTDISVLPEGHTCNNPIRLTGAGTYTGDTTGSDNYYDGLLGTCLRFGSFPSAQSGRDVTYVVNVPAGKTLSVTMAGTSPPGWDTAVSIFSDCSDAVTSCLSYADDGAATTTNTSGAARDYFVVADGFHDYSRGAYSLNVSITP